MPDLQGRTLAPMEMAAYALANEPKITIVPTPPLPPEIEALITTIAAELADHPHHFNGPQLMALSIEPDGAQVSAYEGTYAHYLAHERCGDSSLGLGAMGVGLVIFDRAGKSLWQLRAAHVKCPDTWSYSLGGGVENPDFRATVLTEAAEELDLVEADFLHLSPVALFSGSDAGLGAYAVYTGTLTDDAEVTLNPSEATEMRWVADPEQEFGDLIAPQFLTVWRGTQHFITS